MAKISLRGTEVNTSGDLPSIGSQAPDFLVTKTDLSDISLADLKGKRVILNIFPSVDTGICAASVRHFNADAASLDNTAILCVSRDLPFAHARFCGAEGIENVESVSELRDTSFGDNYNVRMVDGALAGLLSRAIVVLDESGKVIYTEQVPEIGQEPNYEAALNSLN